MEVVQQKGFNIKYSERHKNPTRHQTIGIHKGLTQTHILTK